MLGQFGLLHALQHEEQVERLFILNTPLARSTKLRPELAAYKAPLPFMRPGSVSVAWRGTSLLDAQPVAASSTSSANE